MVAMPAKRKATDEQLLESYAKHGNIWKVAEDFLMCGQSVHERLQKLGIVMKEDEFTEEQIVLITRFYTERALTRRGDFKLDDLALLIGKSKQNICRKARRLGLTDIKRKLSKEMCIAMSERSKEWHKNNEHPKGMLGKTHSDDFKKAFSERVKKMWAEHHAFVSGKATLLALQNRHKKGKMLVPRNNVSWKGGIRKIGDCEKYFRSAWEANYARVLELYKKDGLIVKWEHEPDTYWFENISRGSRSYTPDFKVWLSETEFYYVEIKGWMDQRSKTKLERFAKYYPEFTVELIQADQMKSIKNTYKYLVEWE